MGNSVDSATQQVCMLHSVFYKRGFLGAVGPRRRTRAQSRQAARPTKAHQNKHRKEKNKRKQKKSTLTSSSSGVDQCRRVVVLKRRRCGTTRAARRAEQGTSPAYSSTHGSARHSESHVINSYLGARPPRPPRPLAGPPRAAAGARRAAVPARPPVPARWRRGAAALLKQTVSKQ